MNKYHFVIVQCNFRGRENKTMSCVSRCNKYFFQPYHLAFSLIIMEFNETDGCAEKKLLFIVFTRRRSYQRLCECSTMFIYVLFIVGTLPPTPPTPLLKGGGQDLPKIESLRGGTKFFARNGDKPEKVGLMQKWGSCLFYYFTVQSHLLCVWGK